MPEDVASDDSVLTTELWGPQRAEFARWGMLAGSTGLEPAASAVTGQRSSQLNYDPKIELRIWNSEFGILSRIPNSNFLLPNSVVGGTGFEPVTAGV
jgi:hypothetical protein